MIGMLALRYTKKAEVRAKWYYVMKSFMHISQETLPSFMCIFAVSPEKESANIFCLPVYSVSCSFNQLSFILS